MLVGGIHQHVLWGILGQWVDIWGKTHLGKRPSFVVLGTSRLWIEQCHRA